VLDETSLFHLIGHLSINLSFNSGIGNFDFNVKERNCFFSIVYCKFDVLMLSVEQIMVFLTI